MKDFRVGEGRLFEALIKSAQYFVGLKTQQDVWEHLGKFVVTYLPAEWSAFAERNATGKISIHHCTRSGAAEDILTQQVSGLITDVLESGFLATQVIAGTEPSMTAFIPIVEEHQSRKAMLVGHRGSDPLPKDLLNIYLAIAGLAGTTFERLQHERELNRYREHLELRVEERTAELAAAQRHNELLLHSVGEGICGMDPDGRITFVNPSAARLLGWKAEELVGRDAHATFHHTRDDGNPYPKEECLVHSALVNGNASRRSNEQFWRKNGTHFPVEFTTTPIVEGSKVVGAVMVFRDITERKRTEEALAAAKVSAEQAKAVAEEASRAKDHFLAVLSHELRTPLSAVIPALHTLAAKVSGQDAENLEMARRNVELEARLIDDLLDVTRIARGKIELDLRPIELCTVVRRAAEVCMPDVEARQLHFGIEIDGNSPRWVDADPARLQQVFWNLIKNAVKFTPHGGYVGVRVRTEDGKGVVEVVDSGHGIEADHLPLLFNAFEQAARSITRQFGGLGLGLAISKALVEMHGGTIAAYSQGRDKGATFIVRLPIANDGAAKRRGNDCKPAAVPARPSKPLRILLVEDHGDTARIMRQLLRGEGHEVQHAADVATALKLATTKPFDVLLSDLGLPDGSGHELLRRLRERGVKPIRAIALSGYGMAADVQKSREAGFDEHVTKPVNFDALQQAIDRAAGADAP